MVPGPPELIRAGLNYPQLFPNKGGAIENRWFLENKTTLALDPFRVGHPDGIDRLVYGVG